MPLSKRDPANLFDKYCHTFFHHRSQVQLGNEGNFGKPKAEIRRIVSNF